MEEFFPSILATPPLGADTGLELGRSREGRPVRGYRFGAGEGRISLIAGCHADEPTGPWLLRRLAAFLAGLPDDHPLVRGREWWVVPHANPDGEARNRPWQDQEAEAFDLVRYLRHVVRELPGDDMEFGFPADASDLRARPENRAIHRWWSSEAGPFTLHGSLHGMGFAAGPWFLVDPAWVGRLGSLPAALTRQVDRMGYRLHDVERRGEKGFHRLGPGFATRPDSQAMREHFLERGDPATAGRFRPSSMEAVRSLGGDPFTLVSEMPLFLTPGVGRDLGPPDPVAEAWRERTEGWRHVLARGGDADRVRREAADAGLRAMPIRDQMRLQWAFVAAAVELVEGRGSPAPADGR
jgi:hypothetical protein